MGGTILIVEDEAYARFFLRQHLMLDGYEVLEAGSAAEALTQLHQASVDLVVLDLGLPDRSGLELLPEMLAHDPNLPVVVLTQNVEVEAVVTAMKLRACDFINKPPDAAKLKQIISHLLTNSKVSDRVTSLRGASSDDGPPLVVGTSRAMLKIYEWVEQLAPLPTSVLLLGESGTGKERVANLLHTASPRAKHRFIAVNTAALPENLLESELFGWMRGAHSQAARDREGLIEHAHRGTLFLDEISAMNPELQVKLLRVIEDRKVRRLGGTADIEVDVRIIAASNRDLMEMVRKGTFREDLYYRIAVFTINIPPLRERGDDIPELVAAYIDYHNRRTGRFVEGVSPEALACLQQYPWPGNVRELRNAIERATILASTGLIGLQHLPPEVALHSFEAISRSRASGDEVVPRSLVEMEQQLIASALKQCQGDLEAAAQLLGITTEELARRQAPPS